MDKKILLYYTLASVGLFLAGLAIDPMFLVVWMLLTVGGFGIGLVLLFSGRLRATGIGLLIIALVFGIMGFGVCSYFNGTH